MILRWLLSKTVRQAEAMRKHVHRLYCAQRDLLSPQAAQAIRAAIDAMGTALRSGAKKDVLLKEMESLENAANNWLKPYPNAVWRENIEVLLVALGVAMGIRTFFLQPFKIPTGSMQPTLFGVTSVNLVERPDYKIPTGWAAVREWFEGVSYVHKVAEADGTLDAVDQPFRIFIF